MKKILIALDYGPTAQIVAESAHRLFNTLDVEITLLHVMEDPVYYESTVYDPIMGFGGYLSVDLMDKAGVDRIKIGTVDYLNRVKDHLGNGNITPMVAQGEVGATILSTAVSTDASLIVVGSHSRKWLEKILMGSIAAYLIEHSSIPLMIVPTHK